MSVGSIGHCAALFGTLATGLDAESTVILVMVYAFGGALVADFRAQPTDVTREMRLAAHECRRHRADLCTVTTDTDAFGLRLDMRFAQARVGAMLARASALETGRNT
jgi:hypothetical protein